MNWRRPIAAWRRYWDNTLFVELALLAVTAPILYFPHRFTEELLASAICLLAAGWVWRRWRIGRWYRPTPADWPIFFLFVVMLPIAVWAAPGPLREEYAIPRALILIWNFFLFWTVVSHGSRNPDLNRVLFAGFLGAGALLALIIPFGMNWRTRFPGADLVISRIPTPLAGRFDGAALGFDSNQTAGFLLYMLPLLVALTVGRLLHRRWRSPVTWLLVAVTGWMGLLLLGTQSRGGLLGFGVGLVVMALINWRWGRYGLLVGGLGLALALPFLPTSNLISRLDDAAVVTALGGAENLTDFRVEVWRHALIAIQDFPIMGLGLGAFRKVVFLLYPIWVPPTYDIAHAHNFFLQSALDFGLPGLVALVAIYLLIANTLFAGWNVFPRAWSIGLWGCLIAQSVYSLLDAVAMGSKPNLFFWMLLALIFSLGTLFTSRRTEWREV